MTFILKHMAVAFHTVCTFEIKAWWRYFVAWRVLIGSGEGQECDDDDNDGGRTVMPL